MSEIVAEETLSVHFETENSPPLTVVFDGHECQGTSVDCALGRVAELSLPWDSRRTARLDVRIGDLSALGGAVLLLEPTVVDEPSILHDKE